MSDLINLNKQELESIADVINKELVVLLDEQKQLDDAIARLNRNMQVVVALMDLKHINEQRQNKTEEKPKVN